MNGKRIIGVIVWLILVVVLGFATFGMFGAGRSYGPWSDWHDRGWMAYRQGSYGMGPGNWAGDGTGFGDSGVAGPYGSTDVMQPNAPPLAALDLTPAQADQITAMRSALAEQERVLFGQIREQQTSLNALYSADQQDWGAIGKTWDAIIDLQRQQIAAWIASEQKAQALLSEKQRKEWKRLKQAYGWIGGQQP